MPVVSNTSPILNLAIIGKLDLLQRQFGEIFIPKTVLKECRLNDNLPGTKDISDALKKGWLIVKEIQNLSQVLLLERELDKGEAEAIVLAIELDANIILLDERDARRYCESVGLDMTGVIGVLLKAYLNGQLKSIEKTLIDLKDKAGFYVNDDLFKCIIDFEKTIPGRKNP